MTPLAAVLLTLAPAAAYATSNSPDPVPGAKVLQPDAAPVATPKPKPAPRVVRPAVVPVATPVVRSVSVVAPAVVQEPVAPRVTPKAEPTPKPKPAAVKTRPQRFPVPPVLGPVSFVPAAAKREPALFFAASALALAALTAGSGAGLVFSWSRH